MNKLTLPILALLTLTQCDRTETVEDRAPPRPAAPKVTPVATKDEAEPAVKVPIDGLTVFGDSRALVTVVAFTDYECPYCVKGEARLRELKGEYGDKLRVALAMQPLPIHDHALLAARAFLAAVEQGKGEAMHTKLFAMNAASRPMDDEGLRDAANAIGLDLDAFDRARSGASTAEALKRSERLASKLGVDAAPTFFINGRRIVGAQPIDTFRAVIDEELAKAARISGDDRYARIMADLPDPTPRRSDMDETADAITAIDVSSSPLRGDKRSPITIAFFSDFECPYSVKAEKTLRELEASKPGQIRIAYKFRPLSMHAHARLAAKAALAAERQNRFWDYHDVLLAHRDALERTDLVNYAATLGLNTQRFESDLDDPALEDRIQADEKQADAVGAKGTPTAFINGHRMLGAQPLPKWLGMIERTSLAR